MREPLERYLDLFEKRRGDVEDLLETLLDLDLERIDDEALIAVLTNPSLLLVFRYLAGPFISEDDLQTLVQTSLSSKNMRDPENARRVFRTIIAGLDRGRFPWVADGREPEAAEKEIAIVASAVLLATQGVATSRRNESKTLQEAAVMASLEGIKFERVPPRTISTLDDAPVPGQYCGECMLGDRKADVVVRMWDGRLLVIECKVSNSEVNSIKRIKNDAAIKAVAWIKAFGERHVVPAATLSGVFGVDTLASSQAQGLTLIWAHDLNMMTSWIDLTGESRMSKRDRYSSEGSLLKVAEKRTRLD